MINSKNDAGLMTLAVRMVIGWTYFSAFWRRTVLDNKLDPEVAGYIGEKFNHFLPNALGIKPIIRYMLENPDLLQTGMVAFTVIEGIVGLFIIFGLFTRVMALGVFGLAMGILLGSGWLGTTCLDEWQIGVLGIATGFVLFLTGSGKYSMDRLLLKRNHPITRKRWFPWVGSGEIPIAEKTFPKFVLVGSLFILGMTLMTNQVFHGGVWGTLHNKSVKPKLEITEGNLDEGALSFDVFRIEGADVYGSWVIGMELTDAEGRAVFSLDQEELAGMDEAQISNHYIAKIRPAEHSLLVPLGAKATFRLVDDAFTELDSGVYMLKITDISGAYWEHRIER